MAAGLPLPKQILAHAHWTVNHRKMSKSLGNSVSPTEIIADLAHIDHVRYILCREGGITNDHDFSMDKFHLRYAKSLKGQLGNLVSRFLSAKVCGTLDLVKKGWEDESDLEFVEAVDCLPGMLLP